MKLFYALLISVISLSSFAVEVLDCESMNGKKLEWNNYRGELLVYNSNGKRILDMSDLTLGEPRITSDSRAKVIDIIPRQGNYSSVASIVISRKNTHVFYDGNYYRCKK